MAPPYAILFMADLEDSFLQKCDLKPLVWWRYIDDIFMIWEHGEEKLSFLDLLNSCHPSIKFTADYNKNNINFLDVSVIRSGNKLITDLYVKPTDTHQYLHASSCHVFHSKMAIPYSQILRLNCIASPEITFFFVSDTVSDRVTILPDIEIFSPVTKLCKILAFDFYKTCYFALAIGYFIICANKYFLLLMLKK